MAPAVSAGAPIRSLSLAPLVRIVATSAIGAVCRLLSDRTPLVRVALAIAGGSVLVAMVVVGLDSSTAREERGPEGVALAAASAGG